MHSNKWQEISSNIKSPSLSSEASLFNYLANISMKYNYIYVETPKAACSSIKNSLINAELGYIVHYDNFEELHSRPLSPLINPAQVGSFDVFMKQCKFKFCFARNPYTRLLSSYLDKIAVGRSWRRKVITQSLNLDEQDEITFDAFVDYVCSQDSPEMDPHWRIQSDLLCIENINYDFIGRFENFSNNFSYVLQILGIDEALYFKRESRHETKATDKLSKYYNVDLKKKVYNKFISDFDVFKF